LTATEPPEKLSAAIRVVTFNVRYDDAGGTAARRREHADEVAAALQRLDGDILCLQEVISLYRRRVEKDNYLRRVLKEMLSEWEFFTPGSESGLAEGSPILYRRGRLRLLDQGVFWLSETPEVPDSRSWGNGLPRYCVWALLQERSGEGALLTANVHLDHRSARSRRKGVQLLRQRLPRIAPELPRIVAGDFNAGRRSAVQRVLLREYRRAAGRKSGATIRFPLPRQIDQIFLSPELRVLSSFVLDLHGGQQRPRRSDHRPLAADIVLPRR
jgi:endonuclease/exonuclease/phosphatase family metal-dependent hydrolase